MKTKHREKLEAMLYGLTEAKNMLVTSELDNALFRVKRMLKPEACPDCGRKASVCVNTLSKCRLSPNNTTEAS